MTTAVNPLTERRWPRETVAPLVREIAAQLAPACQKLRAAGSLRRKRPDVGDVELVLIPVYDPDLFGGPVRHYSALDGLLDRLTGEGTLRWDDQVKRNGRLYKRLVVPALANLPLELFIATEANWGNILTIRTGPARFSERLVTCRRYGGLMPEELVHDQGYLWRFASFHEAQRARRSPDLLPALGRKLACPDEATFFGHLRLPCLPPEERTVESLTRLMEIADRGGVR